MIPPSVGVRDCTDDDRDLLRRIYASTREEELAITGWSTAQKEAFLRMQFDAQHQYYHDEYPEASFQIIEVDGTSAGRLYVWRHEHEITIIDIALLPECRGRGIGSALVSAIQGEAAAEKSTVGIYVEKFNRALRMYARLGFEVVEDREVYLFMRWTPVTSS